jgi:hypothetical protein
MTYEERHALIDEKYMAKLERLNGSEDSQVYLQIMAEWKLIKELEEEYESC